MSAADDLTLAARILAKTSEYLDFPSVVGHETPFLDHLARDFAGLGFAVSRPRNLCVVELGAPGPLTLAHVDRHGAVIAEDGAAVYAAHAIKNVKYGEAAPAKETLAERVDQRYRGEEMFAYDRVTGGRIAYGDVAGAALDGQGRIVLRIEDMPVLPSGTPIGFARRLDRSGDGQVSGQLDNPLSAAVLRVAAEHGLTGMIVFTAEEEIGRSAGHFLDWATDCIEPRGDLIVLDTSPFEDSAATLAGAVVLRRRDATADFSEKMVQRVCEGAMAAHVPAIFKDAYIEAENAGRRRREQPLKSLGLTELGKIVAMTKGAFTGATLQIPTFNYHTNQESTTIKAVLAFARSLLNAAKAEA